MLSNNNGIHFGIYSIVVVIDFTIIRLPDDVITCFSTNLLVGYYLALDGSSISKAVCSYLLNILKIPQRLYNNKPHCGYVHNNVLFYMGHALNTHHQPPSPPLWTAAAAAPSPPPESKHQLQFIFYIFLRCVWGLKCEKPSVRFSIYFIIWEHIIFNPFAQDYYACIHTSDITYAAHISLSLSLYMLCI